jgi:hypothetical protein
VAHLIPFIEEEKAAEEKRTGVKAKPKGKVVIATVKGDVHDIGKNIVSVVLQCNNFEVVNMGVMVPATEILPLFRRCELLTCCWREGPGPSELSAEGWYSTRRSTSHTLLLNR